MSSSQENKSVSENVDEYAFSQTRFLCPNCKNKDGYFGTFGYHEVMGKKPESRYFDKGYKTGDQIGYCTANQYTGNGCQYEWVRTSESDKSHFVKQKIFFPVTDEI